MRPGTSRLLSILPWLAARGALPGVEEEAPRIAWESGLEAARKKALDEGRPLLVVFR